jgi:sialic acid synthase SpsE
MVKTSIDNLVNLLNKAKESGCSKVKLQLYEDWKQIEKEQKHPSLRPEEYVVDTRFYNTVEFETEIEKMEATDRMITKIEGDTFIIRVSLSDRDSLLKNLGIEGEYNH